MEREESRHVQGIRHSDVAAAIETLAPLSGQEAWDNSGWQVGRTTDATTGVMVCLDATDDILDEARSEGCNLVVAHHPLLFRATRQLLYRDRPETVAALALQGGIAVYSSHTALDCAPAGINQCDAEMLGLTDIEPLDPSNSLGRVGRLPRPLTADEFVALVKRTFSSKTVRCSLPPCPDWQISRVAVGGGACGDLVPLAVAKGCQAMVTADCKLNYFLDHRDKILLIDAGHYETEICSRRLLARAVSSAFPSLKVLLSRRETNPVDYR